MPYADGLGDPEKERANNRTKRLALKLEVFAHYGEACACCGESWPRMLCMDHIRNDGAAHRKALGNSKLYPWLKRHGFPPGFQILCHNCNQAKHLNGGTCPHKTTPKIEK